MSYVIHKIRSGDTFEYECSRSTHRIRETRAILESQGVDFTLNPSKHSDDCNRNPRALANTAFGWRDRIVCNCEFRNARPNLPVWLTDSMILAAWNLASEIIENRAAFARKEPGTRQ